MYGSVEFNSLVTYLINKYLILVADFLLKGVQTKCLDKEFYKVAKNNLNSWFSSAHLAVYLVSFLLERHLHFSRGNCLGTWRKVI